MLEERVSAGVTLAHSLDLAAGRDDFSNMLLS